MPLIRTRGDAPRTMFHARYTDGTLTAITGETATFARTASVTPLDARGATYTVLGGQPAFQWTASELGLLTDTNTTLHYPAAWPVRAMSIYTRFVERGAISTASARVWHLGGDTTGARLFIEASSSRYRATHHNGTSSVQTAATTPTPTTGQQVELLLIFAASGAITLQQSIDGAAPHVTATTATLTPVAWATAQFNIFRRPGGDAGAGEVRVLKAGAGAWTLDQARRAF